MSHPKKIGVSGGIGSGKTYVCNLIEKRGFPVYYSDLAARRLMNDNATIRKELITLFGSEVYSGNELNRPLLASLIFNDEQKREQVNKIVHPQVHSDFNSWTNEQDSNVVFYESALLFETKAYLLLDATILVTAPLELRIERTMKRDNATKEQVESRIASQGDQDSYRKLATYCVENGLNSDLDLQLDVILKHF